MAIANHPNLEDWGLTMSDQRIVVPGMPEPTPNAEAIVSEMLLLAARVGHEANRAYCKSLGDESQVPWDEAQEWQKQSAYAGASNVLANPLMTPRESHDLWMEFKEKDGWAFGEVKDEQAKTHPCMVPYDDLPLEIRFKDELFTAVVHAVLQGVLP